MCSVSIYGFVIDSIKDGLDKRLRNSRVLEVGSRAVNGSIRPLLEFTCSPAEYVGVDVVPGDFVDQLVPCEALVSKFGRESFDAVICTELLEHVASWKTAVTELKAVLKIGGIILITTRARGYGFHGYPFDRWRYETSDVDTIFRDFRRVSLLPDPEAPGVFYIGQKVSPTLTDLSGVSLYSMILGKRTTIEPEISDMPIPRRIEAMILLGAKKVRDRVLAKTLK